MRDLIVTENITVDGVIDMELGWAGPVNEDRGRDMSGFVEAQREQRERADALLVGRVTFESFRGYWPEQTDDPTGTSEYLNRVAKYVVSSTLDEPEWRNTTVLTGDLVDEVKALKAADGHDIVATGSTTLVRSLIAAGLVDEYRLFVYPVVAGEGDRLFENATAVPPLRLQEARDLGSGFALLRYRTTAERQS